MPFPVIKAGPKGYTYSGAPIPGIPKNEPTPLFADTPTPEHIETIEAIKNTILNLEEDESVSVYIEHALFLERKADRLASHPIWRVKAAPMEKRVQLCFEVLFSLHQLLEVHQFFGEDIGRKISAFHMTLHQNDEHPVVQSD